MIRHAIRLCAAAWLGTPFVARAAPVFKHVVIIFQENRTPDNLFGSNPTFEPGVDIATTGKTSLGATVTLQPVSIASCYDISHTHTAFLDMYHDGMMDGANREQIQFTNSCAVPPNPQYAYADNTTGDITPYFTIAEQFGFANRMFQTNQGPSFPAHQFIFGATSAPTETSRLFASENMSAGGEAGCLAEPGQGVLVIDHTGNEAQFPAAYPCFDRHTVAELLDRDGIAWKYYRNTTGGNSIWNAPAAIKHICDAHMVAGVRTCTGPDYVNNVIPTQSQVLTDIANCNLAGVSWVIPNGRDSDHAGDTQTTGPAWVASIVNAIGTQPKCADGETYWDSTAIFISWDDWGGWYDHVPPFHTGGWPLHDWGAGYTYGFRVPLLVVSAYTQAGMVDNDPHDFGSILAFVESNFGLPKIGAGYYADYFATGLQAFFPLTAPRPFATIPAKVGAAYFLHRPVVEAPPDND
jgi:phospholipase C